jgi:hypothetical protein
MPKGKTHHLTRLTDASKGLINWKIPDHILRPALTIIVFFPCE